MSVADFAFENEYELEIADRIRATEGLVQATHVLVHRLGVDKSLATPWYQPAVLVGFTPVWRGTPVTERWQARKNASDQLISMLAKTLA